MTKNRRWSFDDVMRRNFPLFYVVCLCYVLTLGAQVSPSPPSHDADRDKVLRNVHVDIINSTSVTLRWSPPTTRSSQGSTSCLPQRYTIRLKEAGIRQSKTWKLEGDRHSVSLHDLQPATEYQLRLMATMCNGQRKHSRWVKVTTPQLPVETSQQEETEAPGQPTSVRVRTFVDSAIVSWLPPEDSILVRTYMIGYGEGVPDVKWIYVNGSQRNVTINNLKPSTQYVFSIRAMNNFGKGLVVYDLVYTLAASPRFSVGGSLPAPTNLQSKVLTPTSINLQWTDPSLDTYQRITDERYYNVYYQAAPAGNNLSVIVKALHVTLPDLLPNRQYRFKVRTVKGSQTSPFSDVISNWTRMDSTPIGDIAPPSNRVGGQSTPQPNNARPGAAAAPGGVGGLVADEEDYGEEWDEDDITTGHIDVLQQQGKTKRAHQSRPPLGSPPPQPAMARTLINYPQSASSTINRTSTASTSTSSSGSTQIQFRTHVQYRVSAYVMWPEHPAPCQQATPVGNDTQPIPNVGGYLFRYKAVDDETTTGGSGGTSGKMPGSQNEYIIRNLAANFVLLDNLMPGFKYRFQVRYVFDKGEPSAWSQESVLDTSYNPNRP